MARLSPRSTRRIARSTGLTVIRAWGRGGYVFSFVTDDHRHGWWDKKTGEWEFSERRPALFPPGHPRHPTAHEDLTRPHFQHYGGDASEGDGCEGMFGPKDTWPEDRR